MILLKVVLFRRMQHLSLESTKCKSTLKLQTVSLLEQIIKVKDKRKSPADIY